MNIEFLIKELSIQEIQNRTIIPINEIDRIPKIIAIKDILINKRQFERNTEIIDNIIFEV